MDQKEIFIALNDFSQNMLMSLAEVEAIKKHVQAVLDENAALRLENVKLRERLDKELADGMVATTTAREKLESIYDDGIHICNEYYGSRLGQYESCLHCLELLDRK